MVSSSNKKLSLELQLHPVAPSLPPSLPPCLPPCLPPLPPSLPRAPGATPFVNRRRCQTSHLPFRARADHPGGQPKSAMGPTNKGSGVCVSVSLTTWGWGGRTLVSHYSFWERKVPSAPSLPSPSILLPEAPPAWSRSCARSSPRGRDRRGRRAPLPTRPKPSRAARGGNSWRRLGDVWRSDLSHGACA